MVRQTKKIYHGGAKVFSTKDSPRPDLTPPAIVSYGSKFSGNASTTITTKNSRRSRRPKLAK